MTFAPTSYLVANTMFIIPHFLEFIALLKARPRLKGLLKITQAILFKKK